MKLSLIPEWRKGLRMFSVQAMSLSISIQTTWLALPQDLKPGLPAWVVPSLAIAVLVLGIAGRFLKQEGVSE